MVCALLDANVLYPAPVRDLLLSLAEGQLFKPFWTEKIQLEWSRNLLENMPEIDPKRIEKTISLMDEAFPDALIGGFEHLIDGLKLKDPDDRHVLAAAIHVNVDYIVTANLKDFEHSMPLDSKIKFIHPDRFAMELILLYPEKAYRCFENMLSRLKNPPISREEALATLRKCGLVISARLLKKLAEIQE